MDLIRRLLGNADASKPKGVTRALQKEDSRRDLLRMAVRDTLSKHGIPSHWIAAEVQVTSGTGGNRGMHLRLVMREWHPELLIYAVSLQRAVQARLLRLDPLCAQWVTGVTWKFNLVDDSTCPPLPSARHWGAVPKHETRTFEPKAMLEQLLRDGRRGNANGGAEQHDFRPTEPMRTSN